MTRIFLDSWWVIAFSLLCFAFFEKEQQKRKEISQTLTSKVLELQKRKNEALALQDNLLLQIKSQNDPEWIELTLMRVLGLAKEGQKKMFFRFNLDNAVENDL